MNKKNVLIALAFFIAGSLITAAWYKQNPTDYPKTTATPTYLIKNLEFTAAPANSQSAMALSPGLPDFLGKLKGIVDEAEKREGQARIDFCCEAFGGKVFTRDGGSGCSFDPGLGGGGMDLLDICINEVPPEATV